MDIDHEDIERIVESIVAAISSISHGGVTGPDGLELVAMAIAGDGLRQPLGPALDGVAEGLHAIAESIDGLTEAIREKK